MSRSKLKSIESVVNRIQKMTDCPDDTRETIEHMVTALVRNRDRIITRMKSKARERKVLINERVVSGALRDTIAAHGPITKDNIGSATKRIVNTAHVLKHEDNAPIVNKPIEKISVVTNKTERTKLTVTANGEVRIKIGRDCTSEAEKQKLIEILKLIALKVNSLNRGKTLRGRVDNYGKMYMQTENKDFYVSYDLNEHAV